MTKYEAIEAMKQGKRVTHHHFTDDEWATSDPEGCFLTFEDGCIVPQRLFWSDRPEYNGWSDGWSIHHSNTK